MNYFNLYSCCIPVKGYKRSIVCDIQREDFVFIPNELADILLKNKQIGLEILMKSFDNYHETAEWMDYLINEDFAFYSTEKINFPDINLIHLEAKAITNAIIVLDEYSDYDLRKVCFQLSSLKCQALEIRVLYRSSIESISQILDIFSDSSLRSIEVVFGKNGVIDIDSLIKLRLSHSRLYKIIIWGSEKNAFVKDDDFYILFCTQEILDNTHCGVISPDQFVIKTELFIEAQKYNSCLNRKVAIDKNGDIKNCPSMLKMYGNICNTDINDDVKTSKFQEVWTISKNNINKCRDCEFRYICQDCRAYVNTNELDKHPSPLKCNYDPYEATWY